MKLAVSNIAWASERDAEIATCLRDAGVDLLEVAPGRLFADPAGADMAAADNVRALWADRGLPIASMQSLLYGQPELALLGPDGGSAMIAYLGRIFSLGSRLGAGPMVFGSPRNRLRGDMDFDAALRRAVPVLRTLSGLAEAAGTILCLEPNAPDYGCDFMTCLAEAAMVVEAVDRPGVKLVVDSGNMAMVDDDPALAARLVSIVRHLHLSRPQLLPLMAGDEFPRRVMAALREAGYDGIVTVEMRAAGQDQKGNIRRVAELVRKWIDAT